MPDNLEKVQVCTKDEEEDQEVAEEDQISFQKIDQG